jgi:hypothetical protein
LLRGTEQRTKTREMYGRQGSEVCIRSHLDVRVEVLNPVQSDSAIRPAILRNVDHSFFIHCVRDPVLLNLQARDLETICPNALDDRYPFPNARLYRKGFHFLKP